MASSSNMQVDLAWCLSCDKHNPTQDPLYCSFACRARALADKGSAALAPFEHVRALESSVPVAEQIDLKLKKIIEWRAQVRPGLSDDSIDEDDDDDSDDLASEPSPSISVSPRFPLSASVLAPPRLALPLPPSPVLLPAADDVESSCPPTLSLSGADAHEEPLVLTPPSRSLDGAHGPAIRLSRSFDDRLKAWLNPADKAADELLPAGVDASAYSLLVRTHRRQSPASIRSVSDGALSDAWPVARRGRSPASSGEIPDAGSPVIPIRRTHRAGADTRLH